MLKYSISPKVEAFSTNITDTLDFEVTLPLHQAHSAFVRRVPEEIDDINGVDALITNKKGLRIGVKTADCVPILLYDENKEAVAAIHSGWKGTVQNIIAAAIKRMQEEFDTNPADIQAVIGPCIHIEAFEVGDEVYEKFAQMPELQTTGVPAIMKEKWHINLPAVCEIELLQSGVKKENIVVRPECTWTQHDIFYSARRLGKMFDRQRIQNCIMIRE